MTGTPATFGDELREQGLERQARLSGPAWGLES